MGRARLEHDRYAEIDADLRIASPRSSKVYVRSHPASLTTM